MVFGLLPAQCKIIFDLINVDILLKLCGMCVCGGGGGALYVYHTFYFLDLS